MLTSFKILAARSTFALIVCLLFVALLVLMPDDMRLLALLLSVLLTVRNEVEGKCSAVHGVPRDGTPLLSMPIKWLREHEVPVLRSRVVLLRRCSS